MICFSLREMECRWTVKIEASLRLCATLLLVLSACLVGLDIQRKVIFYIDKKVTYKDLHSLEILVYIDSVAAAYNLLQLSRCSAWFRGNSKRSYRYLAWACYLLDQIAVYIVLAANSAAMEHAVLVVTGANDFQWTKWCNKFARFCFQIGGALACGYVATCAMAFISFISAFNLFRLYSPKQFLLLKDA